jgi:hypothetical protein
MRLDVVPARINRLVVLLAMILCLLPVRGIAQDSRIITPETISDFQSKSVQKKGIITCYTGSSTPILGVIKQGRGKSTFPYAGGTFVAYSPTINSSIELLSNRFNQTKRKLRGTRKGAAKAALQKKLRNLQKEIQGLGQTLQWCNSLGQNHTPDPDNGGNQPSEEQPPAYSEEFVGPEHSFAGTRVIGSVTGNGALVTLANDNWIESRRVSSGSFEFSNVPAGRYSLSVESSEGSYGPSHTVTLGGDPSQDAAAASIAFALRAITSDDFLYHWHEESISRSGHSYTADPGAGASSLDADSDGPPDAAAMLLSDYRIELDGNGAPWSNEFAQRLLLTIGDLWEENWGEFPIRAQSNWTLSNQAIQNDIEITQVGDGSLNILISAAAFANATPLSATVDEERGRFFSRRLFKAVLRYITSNGRNAAAADQIMREKFHVSLTPSGNIYWLTSWSTQETPDSFQEFGNSELMDIMTTLAELPEGLNAGTYSISLLRRKNSVPHPKFPGAPLVVWLGEHEWQSYIEFMQNEFTQNPRKIFQNIIWARGQLLWHHRMAQPLQNEWIQIGQWVYDPISKTWDTANPTEVGPSIISGSEVSPRADFGNALAEYLGAPEQLRFRSPARFEFIHTKIMHGYRYYQTIRDDLQFPVLNLRPDFSYPGKINSLDIRVQGRMEEDKQVSITLGLEGTDLLDHGAKYAQAKVINSATGEPRWLYFAPVNPDPHTGLSLTLKATFTVSRFAPSGTLTPKYLMIVDGVQNTRIQRADSIGWKLLIRNNQPPLPEPQLEPGSASLGLGSINIPEGVAPTFIAHARVQNLASVQSACVFIASLDRNFGGKGMCTFVAPGSDQIHFEIPFSPFTPSGRFGLYSITLYLINGSQRTISFSEVPQESAASMPIVSYLSPDSDETPPALDINNIYISATPVNLSAPDGETRVNIRVRVFDDKSGLSSISYCLKSPLDLWTCGVIWDPEMYTTISPPGTTGLWREFAGETTLPPGSAPGQWGLASISLSDKASNYDYFNFTELLHFQVDGH